MRKSLIVVVAGALLLGACASQQWVNPNVTPEQARLDGYNCQRDTYAAMPGMGGDAAWQMVMGENFYDQCLAAHGYHPVQQ